MTTLILDKVNEVIKSIKPMSHIIVFDGASFKTKSKAYAEIGQEDSGLTESLYDLITKNISGHQILDYGLDGTKSYRIQKEDLLNSTISNAVYLLDDRLPSQKGKRKNNRYSFSKLHNVEGSIGRKDYCNAILTIFDSCFRKQEGTDAKMSKETLLKVCEALNRKYGK